MLVSGAKVYSPHLTRRRLTRRTSDAAHQTPRNGVCPRKPRQGDSAGPVRLAQLDSQQGMDGVELDGGRRGT